MQGPAGRSDGHPARSTSTTTAARQSGLTALSSAQARSEIELGALSERKHLLGRDNNTSDTQQGEQKMAVTRVRLSVVASFLAFAVLLVLSDRRLHVIKFLVPALLYIGAIAAVSYYMEARNWTLPLLPGRKLRRVSDAHIIPSESA